MKCLVSSLLNLLFNTKSSSLFALALVVGSTTAIHPPFNSVVSHPPFNSVVSHPPFN